MLDKWSLAPWPETAILRSHMSRPLQAELLDALRDVVGEDRISVTAPDLVAYSGDFWPRQQIWKLGGEVDGLDVLHEVVNSDRTCETVLITAHSSIDTCKKSLRDGAYDYISKPIDLDLLRATVKRAAEKVMLTREKVL